jgi:hypothetical protein
VPAPFVARAARHVPVLLVVCTALAVLVALVVLPTAAAGEDGAGDATVCHDGSLPRQKTEVDASIAVAGFDPALGTLLEVQVPSQAVHLDTEARFENTAQTPVTFAETMTYQVAFTSPGGLASPTPISGSLPRVPSQTLAAFDGTLDYAGPSAVTQPPTTRDESTGAVASSDPGVLAAFTGGSVPFHVATSIGEVFNGGGGNVQASIETYVAATVQVCYRYAPPPAAAPPEVVPASPAAPPPVPVSPRFTG